MVGDREPAPCSRWAQDKDGWCGQHYVSLHDAELRVAQEAERQLQLTQAIDAFIAKASDPNWKWYEGLATSAQSTRGLAGIDVPEVERPAPRVRKLPFRLA